MSEHRKPMIARPDAESALIVQQSIRRLVGREEELSAGFYGHLYAMLPEARELFSYDAGDRTRLLEALLGSVQSLHDPAEMEARLQALGEVQHRRGIQEDQFQYVTHALVRTLRDVVPGQWSTWLSSAWISVFSWMVAHLALGARRARARAEAPADPSPVPEHVVSPVPGSGGDDVPGHVATAVPVRSAVPVLSAAPVATGWALAGAAAFDTGTYPGAWDRDGVTYPPAVPYEGTAPYEVTAEKPMPDYRAAAVRAAARALPPQPPSRPLPLRREEAVRTAEAQVPAQGTGEEPAGAVYAAYRTAAIPVVTAPATVVTVFPRRGRRAGLV